MKYDGRWLKVAEAMAEHYGIKPGDKILDIGCGKGFLMYDFTQAVPEVEVFGLDISKYAKEHAKEEVRDSIITETPESFHGRTISLIWFFPSTRSTTSRTSTLIPHSRKWRGSANKRSISASSLTETRRKKPICYIGN